MFWPEDLPSMVYGGPRSRPSCSLGPYWNLRLYCPARENNTFWSFKGMWFLTIKQRQFLGRATKTFLDGSVISCNAKLPH